MGIGDWGWGLADGDWGLGMGIIGESPIQIPNPHYLKKLLIYANILISSN